MVHYIDWISLYVYNFVTKWEKTNHLKALLSGNKMII